MKPKEPAGNVRWKYRVRRDRKGTLHVDTMVDGKRWQHHAQSQAALARWSELMAGRELIKLTNGECACDLSAGQGIEHDGSNLESLAVRMSCGLGKRQTRKLPTMKKRA